MRIAYQGQHIDWLFNPFDKCRLQKTFYTQIKRLERLASGKSHWTGLTSQLSRQFPTEPIEVSARGKPSRLKVIPGHVPTVGRGFGWRESKHVQQLD